MIFQDSFLFDKVKKIEKNTAVSRKYKYKLSLVTKRRHFRDLLRTAINFYKERPVYKDVHVTKIKIRDLSDIGIQKEDMETPFMPQEIEDTLRKSISNGSAVNSQFTLNYGSSLVVDVNAVGSSLFKKIDIRRLFLFMNIVVPFLSAFASTSTPIVIKVFLFPSSLEKRFNDDYEVSLDTSNINSGFTTHFDDTSKHILVYRAEEYFKVLLHELIHAFKLDLGIRFSKTSKTKAMISKIRGCLNVHDEYNNGSLLLEETYCEFWTVFIYTLFYSVERTVKTNVDVNVDVNMDDTIALFIDRFNLEYFYNIIKTNNIIEYHTKIHNVIDDRVEYSSSLDILFKCGRHGRHGRPLLSDGVVELFNKKTQYTNTSLFEYIPLKTLLMSNIDIFFEFREKYENPINVHCSFGQIHQTLMFFYLILKEHTVMMYDTYKDYENHKGKGNGNGISKGRDIRNGNGNALKETLCMTTFH